MALTAFYGFDSIDSRWWNNLDRVKNDDGNATSYYINPGYEAWLRVRYWKGPKINRNAELVNVHWMTKTLASGSGFTDHYNVEVCTDEIDTPPQTFGCKSLHTNWDQTSAWWSYDVTTTSEKELRHIQYPGDWGYTGFHPTEEDRLDMWMDFINGETPKYMATKISASSGNSGGAYYWWQYVAMAVEDNPVGGGGIHLGTFG